MINPPKVEEIASIIVQRLVGVGCSAHDQLTQEIADMLRPHLQASQCLKCSNVPAAWCHDCLASVAEAGKQMVTQVSQPPAYNADRVREDIGDAIQALRSGWPAADVIAILQECSESIAFAAPVAPVSGNSVVIKYKNHRNKIADRHIVPIRIRFGSTEWHPEEQWLLEAFDIDRGANRSFALKDVLQWSVRSPVSGNGTEPVSLDWTKCGIVELAVRNPNVASYIEHWEGRALAAEAELAKHKGDCGQSERDARLIEAIENTEIIYYGPRECDLCGAKNIIRGSVKDGFGDIRIDWPVNEPFIYPNHNWIWHRCAQPTPKEGTE